jgi:hypothetical protein
MLDLISFSELIVRRPLEMLDLLQPTRQWVPTGDGQVHHPSLMNAREGCPL